MGQKHSTEAGLIDDLPDLPAQPFYSTKRYTTDELLYILNQATKVTFTHSDEFRTIGSSPQETDTYLKTALVNLQRHAQEEGGIFYDASFEDKKDFEDIRLSKSIAPESIPFATATLVKQAFMHWDFIDQPNKILRGVHDLFVRRVEGAMLDLLDELEGLNLDETQKIHKTHEILNERAEFLKPNLVYAAQMLFISYITDLAENKYKEEAKAIHQFFRVCKKIIAIMHDSEERKRAALMVSPVLFVGLHLDKSFLAAGPVKQKYFNAYLAIIFNLAMRHPVFDEDYDPATYKLYGLLNQKCQEKDLGVSVNPAFAPRDIPDFFFESLKRQYADIAKTHFPELGKETHKAVFHFFIGKITSVATLESAQQRAQDMHNVIYLLKLVYQQDAAKDSNEAVYAKLLRQLLQVPSQSAEVDAWFDTVMISCLLKRNRSFKEPFAIGAYKVSPEAQLQYCTQLTQEYLHQSYENSMLKARLRTDEIAIQSKAEEIESLSRRLDAVQKKLTDLQLENKTQASQLSTTPPSTPPTGRHHFPHHRKGEQSPPKARKTSNPEKFIGEKTTPKEEEELSMLGSQSIESGSPPRERGGVLRTLSESLLRHKK